MFKEARIKLTAWYLAIIMTISLTFSGVIYLGVNRELTRIGDFQKTRIQGMIRGFPDQFDTFTAPDFDAIDEARARFVFTLGIINLSILILSGLGGYFLAGQTLDPIKKMVDEQKEFVSNASHELRTPLTSLMTEIEVALRDKKITLTETKKLLQSNLEEVKKMSNLSNYLLRLNKLQDGKETVEFKKVDIRTIVKKAIEKVSPIASAKRIKVVSKLSKLEIEGNEESLGELVTILLDNAIKYSSIGKRIEITIKNKSLAIKDEGVGIDPRDMPHIFDRFYRADSSRNKEKTNGYGLGLSIAKSIAELNKANIEVKSKLGKGSTFTITF